MANTNLLRSLANISGMTFISRVLGFVRDTLMASAFGAGVVTDAFYIAFRLPNLLRRIFAEGAFSQAFVPILAEYKNRQSIYETKSFIADISGLLSLILIIFTALGIIFSGAIILITAPGFSSDPTKFMLAATLLKITFPYILFISLTSLVGSILNTWGIFAITAFTPTILNICWIIAILFLRHYFAQPIIAIAWGVFIGGFLQLLFQLPSLKKIGMLTWPRLNFKDKAVKRVLVLMIPAIFATSISQISIIINTIFASFLPNGSISWMNFADRIMEFPTGILGVALGTILLPNLSKHASDKNSELFSKTLDWGARLCLLLALPATIGLAIIAKQLTMTLFMHGKFTMFDAIMTERALIAYSVGLLGLILVKVFAPGFYANQNIMTPVKIAIFSLICTQIMNIIFVGPFKHAGLALAISLGACINAGNLCYQLIKKGIYQPQKGWLIFSIKLIIANAIMAIILKLALIFLPFDFIAATSVRIISLLILLFVAGCAYFISLFLLGFKLSDFSFREHIEKL